MKTRTYMDYNATAPLHPEVREVVLGCLEQPHNASSVHSYGREARKLVEDARGHVAALVEAPAEQVIFNSGATEGNNTVLQHFQNERILTSAIEHPSVRDVAMAMEEIPVTSDGIVDLQALENLLAAENTALVSVMMVNNETGVIQPVQEIAALTKRYGALFHCDAVQAAGRIPININTLQIDFLTLSAHKIGGPQGVGALILGLCGITPTLLFGGGQEKKARAGTENVTGIAGFGKAAEIALAGLETLPARLKTLRDRLEDGIKAIEPTIKIYGETVKRAPNTSLFSIPGARSESLLMNFDLEGIALSNGSACTSGSVQPSHVLQAMGADNEEAASGLRVSLGWATTEEDIENFIRAFDKIHARISEKGKARHA